MISASATRWFVFCLIILGIPVWAATGNAVFLRLTYLGLALMGGAWVLSIMLVNGIKVHRSTRLLRASVGDVFEEQFQIEVTTWPGCPWLEIHNESTLPSGAGSRLLTFIGKKEKRIYIARTQLSQRGAFLLGPTTIIAGDPFGLFPVSLRIPARETLVVLPMTFPIQEFQPPPGLLPGGKTIRARTSDVTPHAAGVREYVPGDAMKRIHWPSTVRRGVFMVKEFEQDPQAEIWLFIDGQRMSHFKKEKEEIIRTDDIRLRQKSKIDLPCDTFEYSISAAGTLAQYFIRNRRAVGLACSSMRFSILPSDRGERQLGKLMETLAFLNPDGSIPISGLVRMQAKLLPTGSGVILFTTSTRSDLLQAVEELQIRNLKPSVVLVKAESFGELDHKSEDIIIDLQAMKVPVYPLGFADDMAKALSFPTYTNQRYFHKEIIDRVAATDLS
jgi:uncharacterized protein (DUF58 family)